MTDPFASQGANLEGVSAANVTVTGPIKEALRGTRSWVKLIGILLFVCAALTVLAAGIALFGAALMGGSKHDAPPPALMAVACALYLAIAAIYGFLGVYLLKYSSAIGQLMINNEVATLEVALQSQQKFWRLAGILALVMLAFAVIGIIAAIAIPIMASRS